MDDRSDATVVAAHEIELSFRHDDLTLVGSLHLPADADHDRPFPALVLAPGSGPTDRHGDGYLTRIRQAFLPRGIATFAFDKPGCGASSGDWRHDGLLGRAEHVMTALDLVRDHPSIDARRVGLWGHSQGGWLVQLLAGRPVPLAVAIANSAPTLTVGEQIRYDIAHSLRAAGHDDVEVAEALALTASLQRAAVEGVAYDTIVVDQLDPIRHRPWFRQYPTPDSPDDWRHVSLLVSEPFEPVDALGRVEGPILAVFGGRDHLLPPWQCARDTGDALAVAPTADATVVVCPTGGHRLDDVTGAFVDGYLDLIGDWAASRLVG